MEKRLDEKCIRWKTELGSEDKQFFFGMYQDAVPEFEFLMGECDTITEIVKYLLELENTLGLIEFAKFFAVPNEYKISKSNTSEFTVGRFFGKVYKKSSLSILFDAKDLSSNLFLKLEPVLKQQASILKIVRPINQNIIKIVPLTSGYRADVICVFCEINDVRNDALNKVISIQCSVKNASKYYWNLTNFKNHLKLHEIKSKKSSNTVNETVLKNERESDASFSDTTKLFKIEDDVNRSTIDFDLSKMTSAQISAIEIVDDSDEQWKFSANSNPTPERIMPKVSVDSESMNELYNQFSNQNLFLIEAVLSNGECKKHMVLKVGSRNMMVDIVSIAGDGDCLFASLAFQLEKMKIGSIMHRNSTFDLRQKVVQHISNNYDKYKQAIKGTIYERAAMNFGKVENIDIESEEFIKKDLPQKGCWAGTETTMAVSEIFRVNIVVIKENQQPYFSVKFHPEYKRTLFIAYRGYGQKKNNQKKVLSELVHNHYDSICEIGHELLYMLAETLSRRIEA